MTAIGSENAIKQFYLKSKRYHSLRLSADLVKTPEASPKVVLLARRITSSSVSNGRTDMTGPKISSFTQVMSSLQLSVAGETGGEQTGGGASAHENVFQLTENAGRHEVTPLQLGITWDKRLSSTKHTAPLQEKSPHHQGGSSKVINFQLVMFCSTPPSWPD